MLNYLHLLRLIFSAAASEAPVLNDNLVALLLSAKSPSETASPCIPLSHHQLLHLEPPKLIVPLTSSACISSSPV